MAVVGVAKQGRAVSPSSGCTAMPMLAVSTTSRLSTAIGTVIASRSSSADCAASSGRAHARKQEQELVAARARHDVVLADVGVMRSASAFSTRRRRGGPGSC
jgi:hypothetical protein